MNKLLIETLNNLNEALSSLYDYNISDEYYNNSKSLDFDTVDLCNQLEEIIQPLSELYQKTILK